MKVVILQFAVIMTIEVIGCGLGRTGTTSLKLALEQLGLPTYHMTDLHKNKDEDKAKWKPLSSAMATTTTGMISLLHPTDVHLIALSSTGQLRHITNQSSPNIPMQSSFSQCVIHQNNGFNPSKLRLLSHMEIQRPT
ncbi:hypothetical protein AeRB84_008302 [Aphanomyces euteiches]|nr:hypothetical protein AeRB84_015375 [Aphanomyces euteiches]KAH9142190.1 hypothetical protein AeRB84_013715 [Aphanomyces euteiches]KAH9148311.1 hypothetical protein AeRB84_008302 [Aphanomyces euteiches]